jgi:hypothetical protein
MHSVLYPREPRLLMQTWLHVCHYKTALSRLQDYRAAYGRKFLTPRCSPANKATGLRPDNFAPLHGSCPAALAGSQTACMRTLLHCCSGRFSNCIQVLCSHLQWQDTKLQWQDTKLLHRVKDEQTCNNSNNKARCIPAELCKLSRVKSALAVARVLALSLAPAAAWGAPMIPQQLAAGPA